MGMGARMVSSVKLVPNHYDTLGLSPAASDREIAGAFARAMNMFGARSLARAAQIGVAFEVLRNPAKRSDYDRSLGLTSEPQPRQWTAASRVPTKSGLMGSAWSELAKQVAGDNPPAPPRQPSLQDRLEKGAEPKIASFIASSLREPAIPAAAATSARPVADRRDDVDATLERHVAELLAVRDAREERALNDEVRTLEWKRPALALLGLAAVAGIVGTTAGFWVQGGSDGPQQPQTAVTMALPAVQTNEVAAPVPEAELLQPQLRRHPQPHVHAKVTAPRPQIVAPDQRVAPSGQMADSSHPAAIPLSDGVQAPADQLSAQSPAPGAVTASMPLPKGTIAHTIEKIGYSCGVVDSITGVEGAAPGVFKVSCTSGQNYQATPVNGHYHFRKLGGR